jgi:hypothetical protein
MTPADERGALILALLLTPFIAAWLLSLIDKGPRS